MKRLAALLTALITILVLCTASGEMVTPAPTPAPTYTPEEWLALWYQIGSMLRENGNYPYVELQKGDTGYEVRQLQIRLLELNYYSKAVVDVFGSGTYAAMRNFERANGLLVDGIASVEDQRLLFSSYALYYSGEAYSGESGGHGTSPTPTPAPDGGIHNWDRFVTLNPDILDHIQLATPTPAPTIGIHFPLKTPIFVIPGGP